MSCPGARPIDERNEYAVTLLPAVVSAERPSSTIFSATETFGLGERLINGAFEPGVLMHAAHAARTSGSARAENAFAQCDPRGTLTPSPPLARRLSIPYKPVSLLRQPMPVNERAPA